MQFKACGNNISFIKFVLLHVRVLILVTCMNTFSGASYIALHVGFIAFILTLVIVVHHVHRL